MHLATVQKWLPSQRWMKDVSQPSSRYGGLHDGIEHGLYVGRRAADHAQDVGGRGLPGQRLSVSLNSRAFSMAITAWSAKLC